MKSKNMLAAIALLALILLGGCAINDRSYYQSNPATEEDVVRIWGEPVSVQDRSDGTRLLIFKTGMYSSKRFFVIKDGRVVDGGLR